MCLRRLSGLECLSAVAVAVVAVVAAAAAMLYFDLHRNQVNWHAKRHLNWQPNSQLNGKPTTRTIFLVLGASLPVASTLKLFVSLLSALLQLQSLLSALLSALLQSHRAHCPEQPSALKWASRSKRPLASRSRASLSELLLLRVC